MSWGDNYYQEWVEQREEIERLRELVRLLKKENEELRRSKSVAKTGPR